ncbi:uncharacterized protein LOC131307214 [Rhododendron vialii]|uniref:uncharacterized protein LOC131307214 n=1 Tax=Rhododendron vialii TaxID=182163 RepID=UPI00265E3A3D|nr:uncharacterized protein LOC131307214 [Rhododendron vialii]
MLMALTTKNKDGFIDGTITRPLAGSAAEIKQWTRCNTLVKGWILNSISPNIAQSVMYSEDAHELWNELKERFSHTNRVHLFHIEEEIPDCVQGDMSVGEYYTKLKGLWDLHDALRPLSPCSGDTAKELHQYHKKQCTIKFLMGLNGVYIAARGQILLMEPLPTVNKVYSLIIQDEKQRVVSSQAIGKAPEVAAFAVKDGSHYLSKNPHLRCDRCDATGHTSDSCRAHLKCDYCGWKGHTVDICRKLKRATSNGNKGNHQDRKYGSSSVIP